MVSFYWTVLRSKCVKFNLDFYFLFLVGMPRQHFFIILIKQLVTSVFSIYYLPVRAILT
jgi:hypothetical protein